MTWRWIGHIVAGAASALCLAGNLQAFSAEGHRIVAELAQRQLSPHALAAVEQLLASEPETSLAGIATWADEVRDTPAYEWSAPLHYVNFPRGTCDYRPQRDCRNGRCVVGAIERYAGVLRDHTRPVEQRLEALKFVVHFVGDVHQPLHAGYADDRGGNLFQVFYIGRGSNLHALWDGGILRQSRLDWPDYADRLATRTADADSRWTTRSARQWAQASCRLLSDAGVYPPRPGKLPAGYVEKQRPVVERQIVKAGARLAGLLNAVLGR